MIYNFPAPLELGFSATAIDVNQTNFNMDFIQHLLHKNTRALLPYVERALAGLYVNNPIFSGAVDRESLAQIVDRAHHLATSGTVDAHDAATLQALLNTLVLLVLAADE